MTSGRRTAPAALRAASAVALVLAGVLVLGAGPATAAPVEITAAVCPEAPPGMQAFADDVTACVNWGVHAMIGIGAVVSLGSILVGRIFSHPHASRYGAMGIAVVVMVAMTR